MKKSFAFIVTLLVCILLAGCGISEQNNSDTANSSQEVAGYIVEIDGDDVLLLKDASLEEFQKVEDKFASDDPSSNFKGSNPTFDGPDDGNFMYINYKDVDEEISEYEKGDKIKAQIGREIKESYPTQADGKEISLKD
ncbi:hypothetical protein GCM10008983_14950 [Lentibacillus halophilus]|uniref:DUF3221 domain-containing protein n=1 Tax=Lentibacillus halophilus TaxID=295065 RepID=A0ABN0Z8P4_9BACI